MDHRDLVIEDFARSEAELRHRVASLEADVGVYRELTQAAFDALRDLTRRLKIVTAERNRLRQAVHDLQEEHLLRAGADDEDEDVAA